LGDTGGDPIAYVGVEVSSTRRADGSIYLDYLTWGGTPDVVLTRPPHSGTMWRRAWVDGVDRFLSSSEPYRLVQNRGTGLLIYGNREWTDYRISADVTPHMATTSGIAARVQGMRRFYALLLCDDDKARLVKALDGDTVLAETDLPLVYGDTYNLTMEVAGTHIQARVGDRRLFALEDVDRPLTGGGVALVCKEGRTATSAVIVRKSGLPMP
jgi:hypothetical protein